MFSETFRTTLAWLWDRPEILTHAAFLTFVGVMLILTVPREVVSKSRVAAIAISMTGALFLLGVIAWPTGQPAPAIAYGRYDVTVVKNNGGALFLFANGPDRYSHTKSWLLWEKQGELGWDLPFGTTSAEYVGREWHGVDICVGSSPEYRTFITVCSGDR